MKPKQNHPILEDGTNVISSNSINRSIKISAKRTSDTAENSPTHTIKVTKVTSKLFSQLKRSSIQEEKESPAPYIQKYDISKQLSSSLMIAKKSPSAKLKSNQYKKESPVGMHSTNHSGRILLGGSDVKCKNSDYLTDIKYSINQMQLQISDRQINIALQGWAV